MKVIVYYLFECQKFVVKQSQINLKYHKSYTESSTVSD